jgi:hypothetical protein
MESLQHEKPEDRGGNPNTEIRNPKQIRMDGNGENGKTKDEACLFVLGLGWPAFMAAHFLKHFFGVGAEFGVDVGQTE